jgi:PKD repeat protein
MKKFKYILSILGCATQLSAQVPILNSNPSATQKVIYLDFDGQAVTGTAWNTTFNTPTINAIAPSLNSAAITQIWNRISEDYRPFDVNVTTDVAKFNAALSTRRIRMIFTPTSSWFPSAAGGVAYLNSFTWGGNPDTPAWIFTNALSNSPKNCAEAGAHEAGHTLGLYHQSIWNTSCVKTAEYHGGVGSGVISWAPIMGVGYSRNVTIWHNGTNAQGCTNFQLDHGGSYITAFNKLAYRTDDVGDTYNLGKQVNLISPTVLDSGLIATNTDQDLYKFNLCNSRYVTIDVKPWALDTVNYNGANLDVKLVLVNATTNATIAVDAQTNRLNARIGANLTAGNYYFIIDGDGSPNYTDYGSMGQYYIKVTSNNVPTITSDFNVTSTLCTSQSITFNDQSSGTPTNWQWTLNGAIPATSALQNVNVVYNTPGIYTVQLSATSGTVSSCAISKTIQVLATPTINVTGNNGILCTGGSFTLNANGAASYNWMPGNLTGASQILSPSATQVYTLTGSNVNCTSLLTTTINVSPSPTLNIIASSNSLCTGQTATVTASGASNYTWIPGNFSGSSQILSPQSTQVYTINGSNINCSSSTTTEISVLPNPTVNVISSTGTICIGETATLSASGATTYIWIPGNLSGDTQVVNPGSTIIYTITGSDGNCTSETTLTLLVDPCTGINENSKSNLAIQVFPNPFKNELVINVNEPSQITLTNALGEIVRSVDVNGAIKFDTQDLPKAIYILSVKTRNGLKTTKLIKE